MKQVAGQGPHLEAGPVGPKPVAAGLAPAKGVLSILDSVPGITPAAVDLHHLRHVDPGVGHDETDLREHLPLGPFQFADHTPGFRPAFCLVMEIDHLDLWPDPGRAADRAVRDGDQRVSSSSDSRAV
jgi:hypothetical protein